MSGCFPFCMTVLQREILYWLTFIQSHMDSSESHNMRTSSVPSAKRTLRRAFRVIQGHSYWCRQKSRTAVVVVMYNNVEIISETYEDIVSAKLQIHRFQPPRSVLTTIIRGMLLNRDEFILPFCVEK